MKRIVISLWSKKKIKRSLWASTNAFHKTKVMRRFRVRPWDLLVYGRREDTNRPVERRVRITLTDKISHEMRAFWAQRP